MFRLPRPVWLLGWVSLATDAATEAIYPLLPYFLTTVLGAGAVSLGIVEDFGLPIAAILVTALLSGRDAITVGERLRLGVDPAHLHFFDPDSGNAVT